MKEKNETPSATPALPSGREAERTEHTEAAGLAGRGTERTSDTSEAHGVPAGSADGGTMPGGGNGRKDSASGPDAAARGFAFRKPFPTPGDVFALLGIVLGAQIVVSLLLGLVMLLTYGAHFEVASEPVLAGKIMAASYLASMSLALAGMLVYRRVRGGSGPVAHFSRKKMNPVLLLWAFALIVGMGIVLEPFVSLLPSPPYEAFGRGWGAILSLVVFAPLFEETICRGIVLGGLRAKYGVVAAWLFSSLFFGVMHIYPAQVAGAFAVGLVLGFIYIATDSLWAPILLHAANNAVAYAMLTAGYADADLADLLPGRTSYVLVYIAAAALTVVSGYMVWRTLAKLEAGGENPTGA